MFLFQVKNLKKETSRLHNELLQHKMNTAELKRSVTELEAKLQASEEENTLLRNLNEMFGDENDKLLSENESLKKETAKFKQFRMPSSILTRPDSSVLTRPENVIGRKRSKSCPAATEAEGTDEQDAVKARVNFLSMDKLLTLTDRILTFCLFYLARNEALIKRATNPERVPIRLRSNIHGAIGNRIRKINSRVKAVNGRPFQPFCHTVVELAS
jgi:hypothetical protein